MLVSLFFFVHYMFASPTARPAAQPAATPASDKNIATLDRGAHLESVTSEYSSAVPTLDLINPQAVTDGARPAQSPSSRSW